jgi:hypothetical protein
VAAPDGGVVAAPDGGVVAAPAVPAIPAALDRRGSRVLPKDLEIGKTYIVSDYGVPDYKLRILRFGQPFPRAPDARELFGVVVPGPTLEGLARAGEPDLGLPRRTEFAVGLPGQPPDAIQFYEIWTGGHETALHNGFSEVASEVAGRPVGGGAGTGPADLLGSFLRRPPPPPVRPRRRSSRSRSRSRSRGSSRSRSRSSRSRSRSSRRSRRRYGK